MSKKVKKNRRADQRSKKNKELKVEVPNIDPTHTLEDLQLGMNVMKDNFMIEFEAFGEKQCVFGIGGKHSVFYGITDEHPVLQVIEVFNPETDQADVVEEENFDDLPFSANMDEWEKMQQYYEEVYGSLS